MTISTNILNQHPKDWLNGKYLEFVNSRCSLVGTYTLIDTTKEDFNKLVYQSHIELPKEQKIFFCLKKLRRKKQFLCFQILLYIMIPVILFRLYQRDKEPRREFPRIDKPFSFWSVFFGGVSGTIKMININ